MDRPGSGLRRLTGLLLLLNAGLLAGGLAMTHWASRPAPNLEFNAEKIRLLEMPGQGPEPGAPDPPTPAPPAASVDPGPSARACLGWPGLDADALASVEAHLDDIGIAAAGRAFRLSPPLGWWVYQPPFKDAESLRAALEDARQKGVSDLAPVRGGRMANALSLGAFPSLEKARSHAAVLAAKGLREVRVSPRPEAGEVRLVFSLPVGMKPAALAAGWPKGLKPAPCEAGGE